jgi:CDP-diacylglycerol---glycerol-3-phosphate 3-phosphatidyltransferase
MKWTEKILVENIVPFIPGAVKPNHLTLFRIIMSPAVGWFLYVEQFLWGGLLFMFLVVTDIIDGVLARSRNKVSRWGGIYDPFADKLLIGIVAFVLVTKYISIWLGWAIIVVEIILLVQGAYAGYRLNLNIQPSKWGKTKMVLQSVGIMFLILGVATKIIIFIVFAEYILYVALITAIASSLKYGSTRQRYEK